MFGLIRGENAGRIAWVIRGNNQELIAQVNPVYVTFLSTRWTNSKDAPGSRRDVIGINNDDIAGSDGGFHGVIIIINLDG